MEIQRPQDFADSDSEEEFIKPYAIKKNENGEISFVQWSDLLLKEEVLQGIKDNGFQFPSEIQFRAIPQIVADPSRDVLCQAKSGTGKTAVFILAILNMLNAELNGEYLPHSCMVIANTRELAHQIFMAFRKLSSGFIKPPLRIACYIGGISYQDAREELANLNTTPHIIIGALGRLRHLVSDRLIRTENVKYFVVDECDSIVKRHQNFQDLKFLVKNTPPNKQTVMLTATLTQATRQNCLMLLRKAKPPFVLEIANKKVNLRNVQHLSKRVEEKSKFAKLCYLLDNVPFNQAIIFVNKIQKTERLSDLLKMQLFNPICISSNLPQRTRLENYDMFKSNGCRLIVATDLFGRGIDVQKVNLVINYDFPINAVTYMHRAARAGRFGKKGIVISFVRPATAEDNGSDQVVFSEVVSQYSVPIEEIQGSIEATDLF